MKCVNFRSVATAAATVVTLAARVSPKPLCITTVLQACPETRHRRLPPLPRCTKV
jgi:hypothetical protein